MLPAHQKRKRAIMFSYLNTAGHSPREGCTFYLGDLSPIRADGVGDEGGVYTSAKRHRERYHLISRYPKAPGVVVRSILIASNWLSNRLCTAFGPRLRNEHKL